MELYVSDLAESTTPLHLRRLFAVFGRVRSVMISLEPATGHCRGFGLVDMQEEEAATAALGKLHGFLLAERHLNVRPAGEADKASAGPVICVLVPFAGMMALYRITRTAANHCLARLTAPGDPEHTAFPFFLEFHKEKGNWKCSTPDHPVAPLICKELSFALTYA
ncbi:RNA-binding protein [Paraflavisolibacter sp. H34]|uniref:RNA recognition motif domain-containing protein n=1 Tax=Huijunlia imazamoxiresistens TaxID=3127457 RepID=UPI00301777A6